MVKTMKQDITKAIQFSNIDDLFSINNVNFGNCISAINLSELELKDTSTSSTEVCYLDTNIKTGDVTTPFRISIYDKRDDFAFRIVNFPHGQQHSRQSSLLCLHISTGEICYTSKVDFMNRLALKPIDFRTHLINSSIAMVLSSRSIVQPFGR